MSDAIGQHDAYFSGFELGEANIPVDLDGLKSHLAEAEALEQHTAEKYNAAVAQCGGEPKLRRLLRDEAPAPFVAHGIDAGDVPDIREHPAAKDRVQLVRAMIAHLNEGRSLPEDAQNMTVEEVRNALLQPN